MDTYKLVNQNVVDNVIEKIKSLPIGKYEVTISKLTKKRTVDQNALQWKWCTEISQQKGDQTPSEIQAYNKCHFGAKILKEDDLEFAEFWAALNIMYNYEKLLFVLEGDMIPITRLMTTKQKTRYLNEIYKHWASEGFTPTMPIEQTHVS